MRERKRLSVCCHERDRKLGSLAPLCVFLNYSFLSFGDSQHIVKQREVLDNDVAHAISITGIQEVEYSSQEVRLDMIAISTIMVQLHATAAAALCIVLQFQNFTLPPHLLLPHD